VGGRWVYLLKKDTNGKIAKFKARWVAKGYSQRDGIDYTETYAPVFSNSDKEISRRRSSRPI